ncbi:MAG: DUF4136 domain-containing protein [Allomuricauda sp.]
MKTKNKILMLACLISMSCGPTLKISSDYDKSADFNTYSTYKLNKVLNTGVINQLQLTRIENSIKWEFGQRNLKESNLNPDLIINPVAVLKDKKTISFDADDYRVGGIYRPYQVWGAPTHATIRANDYREGSLLVDVLDAKSKKLVWTGLVSADITGQPKDSDKAIKKAISKLMKDFPIPSMNPQSKN